MKNKEKYFNEIIESLTSVYYTACDFRKDYVLKLKSCTGVGCAECRQRTKEWLEQEYQEPITLTEDEKVILKNIDKFYKWVARDRDGSLYVYEEKPIRKVTYSVWSADGFFTINTFKHLFKLIKWEDDPYNIDELLKQNGVER